MIKTYRALNILKWLEVDYLTAAMLSLVPVTQRNISFYYVWRVTVNGRPKNCSVVLLSGNESLSFNAVLQLVNLRISQKLETRLNAKAGCFWIWIICASLWVWVNLRQVALDGSFNFDNWSWTKQYNGVAFISTNQQVGVGVSVEVEVAWK